ncbi:MAG TPA: glycosyltransferase, partial [Stellaceae bacterium]|nr:glycosyltransferase [Stellaceae bacterium]
MGISVVVPVYNEFGSLATLYSELTEILDGVATSAEIVFVDDGSTDGSPDMLDKLAQRDPRVQVLHLRRNYGQTAALMAGFRQSTGEVVIPMDGDGQ